MPRYNLVAIPKSLDDAPQVILGYFTGAVQDHWEVIHAAQHVALFVTGQFHDHPAVYGSAAGRVLGDDELQAELKKAAGQGYASSNVDWLSLALTLIRLIERLIPRQAPAFAAGHGPEDARRIRRGDTVGLKSDCGCDLPMSVMAVDCCGFARCVYVCPCDGDLVEKSIHCSLLARCCDPDACQ